MAPQRIFLDTNKWIDLARAWHGRSDGDRYQGTLDRILSGVRRGQIEVPLASSHVIELARQGKGDRRRRLAEVMVAVSRGVFMAPPAQLIRAIARRRAQALFVEEPPEPVPAAFGRGVGFALGVDLFPDADEERRRLLESSLDTPEGLLYCLDVTDDDLRRAGSNAARRIAVADAASHDDIRARHTMTRDERVRMHYARSMLDLSEHMDRALGQIGRTQGEMFALGHEAAMRLLSENAPLNVQVQLAVARDMHWDRTVQPNDLQDIGALCVAIPYCDFVVTEKFWTRIIEQTGTGKLHGTSVTSDLATLHEVI